MQCKVGFIHQFPRYERWMRHVVHFFTNSRRDLIKGFLKYRGVRNRSIASFDMHLVTEQKILFAIVKRKV
jgi:hypothetical protein